MKVTRKFKDEFKTLKAPGDKANGDEIAPTLFLSGLAKEIAGLGDKGDFQAHVKGKVRRHTIRNEDGGKQTHDYDLDVHDFEPHGSGAVPEKKSSRQEVDEALDKFDKEESEKKGKKEPPAPPKKK